MDRFPSLLRLIPIKEPTSCKKTTLQLLQYQSTFIFYLKQLLRLIIFSSDGRIGKHLRFRSLSTKKRKPSSINGLPDDVLVEILCRLQCNKLVFQCKSVSMRWRNLIENQRFIGRFMQHMQSCYKKTANIRTLMDREAEEFPLKTSSSKTLLTPVFESIKSIHGLRAEPVVVATYNDLVLCCAGGHFPRYYYICNALTMEWVALPPAPSRRRCVWVGFICDIPDFNCENDNWKLENHNNIRRLNAAAECRCKVVRIFPPRRYCFSFNLNVEVFSSETGEWTESVIPIPQDFSFGGLHPDSFVYHGRIYWRALTKIFFVGLGPFYDHNDSTSNGIDHKVHCTVSEEPLPYGFVVRYLGVCRGLVQMCGFSDKILHVFELKEQEGAASGQLCLSKHNEYPLDPKMFQYSNAFGLYAFDPDNKDFMYLKVQGGVFKCNIHTREWLKIAEEWNGFSNYFYPVVFPWWPTPVPILYGTMPHDPSDWECDNFK